MRSPKCDGRVDLSPSQPALAAAAGFVLFPLQTSFQTGETLLLLVNFLNDYTLYKRERERERVLLLFIFSSRIFLVSLRELSLV